MSGLVEPQGRFGHTDWRKHDGGPNPAPDENVDLIWGFGLIERQPSSKVNWSFHWDWRPSDQPALRALNLNETRHAE